MWKFFLNWQNTAQCTTEPVQSIQDFTIGEDNTKSSKFCNRRRSLQYLKMITDLGKDAHSEKPSTTDVCWTWVHPYGCKKLNFGFQISVIRSELMPRLHCVKMMHRLHSVKWIHCLHKLMHWWHPINMMHCSHSVKLNSKKVQFNIKLYKTSNGQFKIQTTFLHFMSMNFTDISVFTGSIFKEWSCACNFAK